MRQFYPYRNFKHSRPCCSALPWLLIAVRYTHYRVAQKVSHYY